MVKYAMIAGAILGTTLLAAQANAGTLTATLGSVNPDTTNLTVSFNGGTTTHTKAIVGELNWTVKSSPAPIINPADPGYGSIAAGTPFQTFCIEGTQTVSIGGSYAYTLSALSGADSEALTEFWNDNIGTVTSSTGSAASINAAAFQLGIWEIVYDYGLDGSKILAGAGAGNYNYSLVDKTIFSTTGGHGGEFTIGSAFLGTTPDAAVTEALAMLHNVTGNYVSTSSSYVLADLSSGTSQDQLAAFKPPLGAPPSVPLPAALPVGAAMLSLLGVVAGVRKRRSNKA